MNRLRQTKFLDIFFAIIALCAPAFSADRNALTFTAYNLQATITPSAQGLDVQGKVTLRNDSNTPQKYAVLQVSSTLEWKRITVGGNDVEFLAQGYTTDIDHTGAVSEAIVTLPTPLAPKASVTLDVDYRGTIPPDAKRLTRIGTPDEDALRSDWDRISEDYVAVRGVGYVNWYPVSMDAVSLSDGNAVFATLADWRRKQNGAEMHATFCIPANEAGGRLIVANGMESTAKPPANCRAYNFRFGPMSGPVFLAGNYRELQRQTLTVFHTQPDTSAAENYAAGFERLEPSVAGWLGDPKQHAIYVDQLARGAAPYESGAMMLAPLTQPDKISRDLSVSYQLAQVSIQSFRPWIGLGLCHFMQFLTVEHEVGRSNGIKYLEQYGMPLATADKSPDEKDATARSLINTDDELFYRAKSLYVWSMLRDMIGEEQLAAAIQSYRQEDDKDASYMQRLIESRTHKSLEWFFDDWVYRDRGLPDFHIVSAYPRQILGGQWLITITVENLGKAAAEVPVMAEVPGGERSVRLLVKPGEKAIARINTQQMPSEVIVNDGSVPESDLSNNRLEVKPPVQE